MAATHYSIRRQRMLDYARWYLNVETLPKEAVLLMSDFARVKEPITDTTSIRRELDRWRERPVLL